jgi:hypothetical protein
VWNDDDAMTNDLQRMLITSGLMLEVVRWDDEEAITQDLLLMRDDIIVLDNAVRLDGRLRWCPLPCMLN